jgi:hypothetical protein
MYELGSASEGDQESGMTIPNYKLIPRVAIAALFHQEAPYLKEFIHYHELVGVSRFYLYDDQSTDDWQSILRPFRESGLARVIPFPLIYGRIQSSAYADAIQRVRRDNDIDLLAIIDIDEFILPVQHNTIQQALSSISFPAQWSALSIPWRVFGDSGHPTYSPEPVTERFTWRPVDSNFHNQWSKSILNLRDGGGISPTIGDPHIFRTQFGTVDERGEQVTCPRENHSAEILRINHYFTKSREEWEQRHPLDRPILGGQYPRDETRFWSVQSREVEDRALWERFGGELSRRLAS